MFKGCIALAVAATLIAPAVPAADLVFPPSSIDPQPRTFRFDPNRLAPDGTVQAVDAERIAGTMMKILPMSSRSCREREIAEGAKTLLEEFGGPMGIEVSLDDLPGQAAGLSAERKADLYCDNGKTAPEAGNVIATLKGDPALPAWNLSFHLDTNQTRFDGIRRDGDLIRPADGTPLGADDKAGLAIIAEILRVIRDRKLAHGDIRVVGLVAEEDGAIGAQLIDGSAFKGDFVVSADGTDPREIGRAAPTTYGGTITVRTQTSHPADVHEKKTVSACAVGARILQRAGFTPAAYPAGHPDVILHSYFVSCGIDEGVQTPKGDPSASYQYNTISPYWTATWQLRSLEGAAKAKQMAAGIRMTMERVCQKAARGRTPVECELTGDARPRLLGYVVSENDPAVQLLGIGFVEAGSGPVKVTARQFGGFNGNYIRERFGEEMLIIGTGANQIHTNEETVSIKGMADAARGLLGAMLQSYRYTLVE